MVRSHSACYETYLLREFLNFRFKLVERLLLSLLVRKVLDLLFRVLNCLGDGIQVFLSDL